MTEPLLADSDLNPNHRRALWATFTHLDTLLHDVETAARSEESASPFARLLPDLTLTQQRVLFGYVGRLRERFTAAAAELGLEAAGAPIAASWSAQTTLHFALIALEEINASRLRGYGPLGSAPAARLERIAAECRQMVQEAARYLAQGLGRDLAGRLAELERAPVDLALLRAIERMVTTYGLVEFRGALQALVEQLESASFEIGVFGGVGSGKSSLLNAVLGQDVLPVGVTPVTAVPTRIGWGGAPRAEIRFAEAPPLEIPLERLSEFVSEEENPANRRLVTRAVVELPSPRLRQGVVFVDTPGLGSLATAGARESYAYLPRCDLGILLLDAAGSPAPEDLELLRLLYDSGIPASVALSKADLLAGGDRDRLRGYVTQVIREGLGIEPPVHFVSTVGPNAHLAQQWFASEVEPLLGRTRELRAASAARKLAHLRQATAAALLLELRRSAPTPPGPDGDPAGDGAAILEACEVRCRQVADELSRSAHDLADLASRAAGEAVAAGPTATREAATATLLSRLEIARDGSRVALLACRDELRGLLQRLISQAGSVPAPSDLQVDLLLLPEATLPGELEELALPEMAYRLLPPRGRSVLVRSSVRRQLANALPLACSGLANRLYAWSRTEISRLGERFMAQAEPLGFLHGRGALRAASAQVDRTAMEADLRTLRTFESDVPDNGVAASA